jgi:O-methyltransferase
MRIRAIPNLLLSAVGLRVVPSGSTQKRFPVEISKSDEVIYRYIRDKKLATASDERLFATIMACRHVVQAGVPGDFVECGVWRGTNSIIAASVFENLRSDKVVWCFDTFAGMTAPTEVDVNYRGERASIKFEKTRHAAHTDWCYAALAEVKANFAGAGVLTERVNFIEGDVAKTLAEPRNLPKAVSVLRLDTDWYESTRAELEALYPLLSPGGILIIDDYGHWGGARKAVDEYFAKGGRPFLQYIDQTARLGVKLA